MPLDVNKVGGVAQAGTTRESGGSPEVLRALQQQLAGLTNDKALREQDPRRAFQQLPESVRRFFTGDRLLQSEPLGLGRVVSEGSHLFVSPAWGNLGSDAAHVLGVAQTPDGRFVPLKGSIAQTWLGRTAGVQLEVAGRSFGPDEAGLLVSALRAIQQEQSASKPVAPPKP